MCAAGTASWRALNRLIVRIGWRARSSSHRRGVEAATVGKAAE